MTDMPEMADIIHMTDMADMCITHSIHTHTSTQHTLTHAHQVPFLPTPVADMADVADTADTTHRTQGKYL
jgi:hypothetical protein